VTTNNIFINESSLNTNGMLKNMFLTFCITIKQLQYLSGSRTRHRWLLW